MFTLIGLLCSIIAAFLWRGTVLFWISLINAFIGKRQSNHTYSLLCSDEIMSPSWQGSDFFDPENQTRTVDRAHRGLPRQWPKPKSMV